MLSKETGQTHVIQYVNLEDLVPKDHILRKIRSVLKLEGIYEATGACYSDRKGRPSVDPTVAFRMILLGYFFNLSEKRLCDEIGMHAGYLWFCGMDFHSEIPDRTTLVKLRRHRWGEKVFRKVMSDIVQQCIEAGLVKGKAVVADGTEVQARAAITSLQAIEPPVELENYLNKLDEDGGDTGGPDDPPPPTRQGGDPDFHGERFSNETHRSKTDPDARLFRKSSGTGAKLSYLVHNIVDMTSGVILGTNATHAFGFTEREAALDLLDEAQEHALKIRYLLADANYTASSFLAQVLKRGVEPLVPLGKVRRQVKGPLRRRVISIDVARRHRADVEASQAAQHVLSRERPPHLRRARVLIERCFAEAKEHHGLRRARGIGLEMMNIQALMTAIAQNLRRLAANPGTEGTAAASSVISTLLARARYYLALLSGLRTLALSQHF